MYCLIFISDFWVLPCYCQCDKRSKILRMHRHCPYCSVVYYRLDRWRSHVKRYSVKGKCEKLENATGNKQTKLDNPEKRKSKEISQSKETSQLKDPQKCESQRDGKLDDQEKCKTIQSEDLQKYVKKEPQSDYEVTREIRNPRDEELKLKMVKCESQKCDDGELKSDDQSDRNKIGEEHKLKAEIPVKSEFPDAVEKKPKSDEVECENQESREPVSNAQETRLFILKVYSLADRGSQEQSESQGQE